jgi:putative endonuclease
MRAFHVYIMTNDRNRVLYTGVTNDLARRVLEHRHGLGGRFTWKYRLSKLVYFESCQDAKSAIAREKQIKGGPRRKKIALVDKENPDWRDLYKELVGLS